MHVLPRFNDLVQVYELRNFRLKFYNHVLALAEVPACVCMIPWSLASFHNVFFFVPRLFEEKWRDTVFGFPWGVVRGAWRVVRGAWRVVRGAWFRVFSGYFVPLTPPTVSVQSF